METTNPLIVIYALYATIWGALWGSFLNVVIWRLPRGQNLAHPPSRCPTCEKEIVWYDNVPVLSWLLLRGRCRGCKSPISARYPAVELIGALLGWSLWQLVSSVGGQPLEVTAMVFLFLFFFALAMVAIAFIDFDLTIIPHSLTFPMMAWGLLGALVRPKTAGWEQFFPAPDLLTAAIGLVAGGGVIYAVFVGYKLATGREGLGGGDATMLAAIGANLGWPSLIFVLMFASLQGLVAALALVGYEKFSGRSTDGQPGGLMRGAHRPEFWNEEGRRIVPGSEAGADAPALEASDGDFLRLALPFGPFLALAAMEYMFWGEGLLRWLTAGVYP